VWTYFASIAWHPPLSLGNKKRESAISQQLNNHLAINRTASPSPILCRMPIGISYVTVTTQSGLKKFRRNNFFKATNAVLDEISNATKQTSQPKLNLSAIKFNPLHLWWRWPDKRAEINCIRFPSP